MRENMERSQKDLKEKMICLDRNTIKARVISRATEDVACEKVPGAAVLVKQNGEVICKDFFGTDGKGGKISDKTLFRLASMTKPITAAAVLVQIERGLVSLDDPLEKFIPEYRDMEIGELDGDKNIVIKGKAQTKITVKHLLSHTSGVGSCMLGNKLDNITKAAQTDLKSITDAYASLPLAFDPYSAQAYSATLGFDLLARIVEITSGCEYGKFLKKEIFEPLGMCDTTFDPTEEQWSRVVLMHSYKDGASSFKPLDKSSIFGGYPLTYTCGGACLVSTLADYEKFTDMLLSGGKAQNGDRILDEESVNLMATPAEPFGISLSEKWGLSVRIVTKDTNRIPVGSYGWSGAYGCHFWIDPKNRITAIYMKNSTYDGGSGAKTAANFEMDVYLK